VARGNRTYDQSDAFEIIDDLAVPIYYIAGPQGMVAFMRKVLTESGVNEDNIRTEEFTGC
jgi:ferredoxin-NADP reductase